MDICVPVICTDETIEVPLKQLQDYEYFSKVLSNGITKLSFDKTQTIDEKNNKFITYTIIIPHLSVGCSSHVLRTLLNCDKYYVQPGKYTDELIEIMMYNDMYGTGLTIHNSTYGLEIAEYIDMIYFIKNKIPTVNAYTFLENGRFWTFLSFFEYSFKLCARNELELIVIEDLLEHLEYCLLRNYEAFYDRNPDFILHIFDTIINCSPDYIHIIKNQVNDSVINNVLDNFVENNHYWCTNSHNKSEYIVWYNTTLEKIFEKLKILADLDIIDLGNIGTIQDFKVY